MTEFDTLSEVILYVEDVARMTDFYTETFGLDIESGAPEHGFVKFDTGGCNLCLHAGRDGDLGPFAPKFVFEVEDVEASRSRLVEHDVEMDEIRNPDHGVRVCDGLDPEGNEFSIESSE